MNVKLKLIIDKGPIFGMVGTVILLNGLILPQFPFIGLQNESYSLLNHFVSELGFLGVSEWAVVFNVCLFIGGLMFLPFVIYVKDQIKGRLWKVGTFCGYIAAIGCALVGVFPMNNETIIGHGIAAMAFFMGSNVMMILFSISLLAEKDAKLPKQFAIAGFIILVLNCLMFFQDFGAMALGFGELGSEGFDITQIFTDLERPDFWLVALAEWLIVLGVLVSLLVLAIYHYRNMKKLKNV